MTIIEITRLIFNFFKTNDIFDINRDFKSIIPICENEELLKKIVCLSLKKLESQAIVSKVDGDSVWVLEKPLVEYSQTIELSFETISYISDIINTVCEEWGLERGKCDPLNIRDIDIQSLLIIIDKYRNGTSEKE